MLSQTISDYFVAFPVSFRGMVICFENKTFCGTDTSNTIGKASFSPKSQRPNSIPLSLANNAKSVKVKNYNFHI